MTVLTGEIVPAGAPMGRYTRFNPEVAQEICERIAEGETLDAIGRDMTMPGARTIRTWLTRDEPEYLKFRQDYARARELQADTYADMVKDIATTPQEGQVITRTPEGVTIRTEDMLGHRRLEVDALKWLASVQKPKKYGSKVDVTSDGEQLTQPPQLTDVATRAAALLTLAQARKEAAERG